MSPDDPLVMNNDVESLRIMLITMKTLMHPEFIGNYIADIDRLLQIIKEMQENYLHKVQELLKTISSEISRNQM